MEKKNDYIEIIGAKAHNLKDASLSIPRGKFVVVTGLSGSGKSSLAFDTIYAEGQRRYMETLSAYARQFVGAMERPDVDRITGLSPVVASHWAMNWGVKFVRWFTLFIIVVFFVDLMGWISLQDMMSNLL